MLNVLHANKIKSLQTHNNPILHDFTSSASAISENSNKDCDNHAFIIKVSITNIQCLTHISLIVLALAVYLALELSAKLNIQGAFQYRKENMFSQVSSKILFKGLVFRCNPLSESFCIFSQLHWVAWLPFIAFQLLQDEETFSVQWLSNKYHFQHTKKIDISIIGILIVDEMSVRKSCKVRIFHQGAFICLSADLTFQL